MEKIDIIDVKQIRTNPFQPRQTFVQEKLEELAASIKENGLIQPIIVRKSPIVGYELLAGERRYRAAQIAGFKEIPAIIRELSDHDMIKQAIIENLQREDLNPIEEAESYQHLIDKGGSIYGKISALHQQHGPVASSLTSCQRSHQKRANFTRTCPHFSSLKGRSTNLLAGTNSERRTKRS